MKRYNGYQMFCALPRVQEGKTALLNCIRLFLHAKFKPIRDHTQDLPVGTELILLGSRYKFFTKCPINQSFNFSLKKMHFGHSFLLHASTFLTFDQTSSWILLLLLYNIINNSFLSKSSFGQHKTSQKKNKFWLKKIITVSMSHNHATKSVTISSTNLYTCVSFKREQS